MVVVQASKLSLPNPSLSSPHITSLLFEPTSLSLALMHSDSSFSLYPSLSPLRTSSSLPPPQTTVPAPCSSSTFVLLQNPNSADPRPLFIASGPHAGGSRILLRFYILQGKKLFRKARVVCNQKDFQFVERFGVLVDSVHGVSVKLAGSVNFFAMYSVSGSKAWIFAVKLVDDEVVKLMRCAVIECSKPVFSITLSFGVLILGEEWGVRVFNLRQLVEGRAEKVKNLQPNSKSDGRKSRLSNGVIGADVLGDLKDYVHSEGGDRCGKCVIEGSSERTCNCYLDGKSNRHLVSIKQRSVRLRQDSSEAGACFLAFSGKDIEASKSRVMTSVKAISIQALSPKKFLILDSAGNLHLLCWFNRVTGSDMTPHIRQLPQVTNVQKLAVLADSSIRTQTVWLSDGHHSLHVVAASDIVAAVNENDRTENEEKPMQISVIQAIFASEKIEDVIPLASNAILILGQGHQTTREETDFNLREWGLKARNISRENTNSRRFSASYIRSFREDTRSFRSNITISSTASSPGYSLRDEIDPSTYSFTTALQALQAKAAYNCWECLSPDGFALNSKWNEAEKYICNPLSGEFPMECLSSKTLSGRSFRNLTNRITMSAPLIYNNNSHYSRQIQTKPCSNTPQQQQQEEDMLQYHFPISEKRVEGMKRDVGTQSTPPELSSSSLSPASTPPITERSLNRCEVEGGDSPNSNAKLVFEEQVKVKETREEEEEETRREEEKPIKGKNDKQKHRHGGCLSWMSKRQREKHKPRKNNFFFLPINLNKGYC